MKKFYLFLVLVFLYISSSTYSACVDSATLISADFSLNDNSFSHDYNGNSGVIEKITRNPTTNEYSMWQTPLLHTFNNGVWTNYYYLGSDVGLTFDVDSNFYSNRRNLLIINDGMLNHFDLYVKITLKNSGTCSQNNGAMIESSENYLGYYGVNLNSERYAGLLVSPIDWIFTNANINEEKTQIFNITASDLLYYGRLGIYVGPVDDDSTDRYQKIVTYFYVEGNPVICGDGNIGYGEVCDDGNTNNGDTCSSDCKTEFLCGNSVIDEGESCDPGQGLINADGSICTSICSRSAVCGDGVIHYDTYDITSPYRYDNYEICDTAFNNQTNYICSSDCTTRYSTCGNGIRENGFNLLNYPRQERYLHTFYYEPREECDGESYCDSTCHFAFTDPIVENLNYITNVFVGDNLTPMENITYMYKVTNNNPIDVDLDVYLRLYNYNPYTSSQYGATHYLNYHQSTITNGYNYNGHYQDHFRYLIPANSVYYINQSVIIPQENEEFMRVLREYRLYETIYYNLHGVPVTQLALRSDWRHYGSSYGLGSYQPQYCIGYLEPYEESFAVTTNNEGIPAIEIEYNNGVVRSYNQLQIPANTFYLKSKLLIENETTGTWSDLYYQNVSINKTFSRTDNQVIGSNEAPVGSWNYRPELTVNQKISFPIQNFMDVNNKNLKVEAMPYFTSSDTMCNLNTNEYESRSKTFELNLVRIEVDNPIVLRPKGGGGYDELFSRLIFFNYEEYGLYDVNFDISIEDFEGNPADNLFDIEFNNVNYVPAGAAFPVFFKIKYIGAIQNLVTKNYKLSIHLDYMIPNSNQRVEDNEYITVQLEDITIPATDKFVDLIPINIDYRLINLNKDANITLKVANQGTLDSQDFDISFYIRTDNASSSFVLVDKITVAGGLGAGEIKDFNFNFTPTSLGENYILKFVVNEDKRVYEDTSLVESAQENNYLTSFTIVRDIDVVLDSVTPLLNEAKDGIIPFNVSAHNKGTGGIDMYELRLTIYWETYSHTDSFFFTQIPQAGRVDVFYWNVTNIEPRSYMYKAELITMSDPDLSDNVKTGIVGFCPLPWFYSATECNINCNSECINQLTKRYEAYCNNINGCSFYNETFAVECNSFLKGSFVNFNFTHNAKCPDASLFEEKRNLGDAINITGDCASLVIKKYPVVYQGESLIMDIINCYK